MIYACFKNFNTIPSGSEELHERPETAQRYIFLQMLSRQTLETYSASVNHEVLLSYDSLFSLTFSFHNKRWTCQIISHPTKTRCHFHKVASCNYSYMCWVWLLKFLTCIYY